MREIKFRAWDKYKKQMFFPSRINFGDDGSALTVIVGKKKSNSSWEDWVYGESCELMQYTGLKDKNGKEIYEGDIIRQKNDKDWFQIESVQFKGKEFTPYWITYDKAVEVIGNIYENPELIK